MPVDVFKGMNEHQREAIAQINGPLLVVAGAGSGKTRVITHRIANIIQHGVRPDRVLAITFTNKAAGEMKDRIERLLGLKTPWITTFHSAGLRILKLEHARTGFQTPFSVIDEDDQKRIYKRIYKELELDVKMVDPRKISWRISQWKNQLTDIAKFEANDDIDIWAQKCHVVHARICQEECLVDFDAGHRQRIAAGQQVFGQPLCAGGVLAAVVEHLFDRGVATRQRIADHDLVAVGGNVVGRIALAQRDAELFQLRGHRRIHRLVAAFDRVAQFARECSHAAHERPGDAEDVEFHCPRR